MELTLKNYNTALPKELLAKAEKNNVRECDETEKGHFVAYVDEDQESFDVTLNILPNGEIAENSCDCKNGFTFCRHKAALLLHVAKGKKVKTALKIKKKDSKTEALLEHVDLNELKEWVRALLEKNKEIALSFSNHFSAKQTEYTTDDVIKLANDAIKVVGANKKNVDVTQLKKLTELWGEVLEPVVRQYRANTTNEKAFLNFHTIIETCISFQHKVNTSSNKLVKFTQDLMQASVEAVNNLYNQEAWAKATGYFVQYVLKGASNVRIHYVWHLNNLISISNNERKKIIVDRLAKQYATSRADDLIEGNNYTKNIFNIIVGNGLFGEYHQLFNPIRFDNEFNIKLIGSLIENGHLAIAKKYCQEQININYKEEYGIAYLQLLKLIYTIQNDEDNLVRVLTDLFPYDYDFNDYLFVMSRMEEESAKKWRTKMLSRASNASNNNNAKATAFCFSLMNHEQKYKKMIEYINTYTPYETILQYFEPMVLSDKTKLLDTLLRRTDSYNWSRGRETDFATDTFPALLELMKKHYIAGHLKTIVRSFINSNSYYRPGKFVQYINDQLASTQE